LDDDRGGDSIRKGLLEEGIPGDRILKIPVPGVENLLHPKDYLAAVTQLLEECNVGIAIAPLSRLPASDHASWADHVERWAREHNLKMPSKVAVANRILEAGKPVPSGSYVRALRKLDEELRNALGVQKARSLFGPHTADD
jgi:sugar phosphate isomerase/epimerase